MRTVAPISRVTPGEMPDEEFLKPLGLANYDMALARETMGEALTRIGRCALLPA